MSTELLATPKSPDRLMAQVAVYASDINIAHPNRQAKLLAHALGDGALSGDVPYKVTAPADFRFAYMADYGLQVVEKGEEMPLFDKSEYLSALRDPNKRKRVEVMGDFISAFEHFRPTIESLGIAGLTLDEAKVHPNFLAHGGSEQAFKIEVPDTDGMLKSYVVRYGQVNNYSPKQDTNSKIIKANQRAVALAAGHGIDGLEQGVAVSYSPAMCVSEFVEGAQLYDMDLEVRKNIPDEHWDKLFKIAEQARRAGIDIDYNTDNFLYNPTTGFTILDYRLDDGRPVQPEHNEEKLGIMIVQLTNASLVTKN